MSNEMKQKAVKAVPNRWFVFCILTLSGGIAFKLSSMKDMFYVPMQQFMGLTNTQIGGALSAYGIVQTIGLIFGIYICDMFSKKYMIGGSLIGLGAIGRETAKICRGCGMKIAGYDPFLSREQIEALGAQAYENYEDLLRAADIVTIHVPLTEQTRDMIAARQLAMMKPTALVINCSRGGIVNEKDLVAALKAGVIAGAGTDVYCNEPPKPDDPLLNCPNLIASPHSAAQTREAVVKMAQMCVKGCIAVCSGEKWPYVADKSVYEHSIWKDR